MTDKNSSAFCTFGLDKWLESLVDVTEAPFTIFDPVQRSTLLAWERRTNFKLPEDLRNFYLSNDGIDLKWYCNNQTDHVAGQIKVLPLMQIKPVKIDHVVDSETNRNLLENADSEPLKLFSLGPADYNSGQICVCSNHSKFYLLDNTLYLWKLPCESFSDYFRLAILHCGIRNWHYIFTDYGLPIMTSFLLKLVSPGRLNIYLKRQKFKIDQKLANLSDKHGYLQNFDFEDVDEDESEEIKVDSQSATTRIALDLKHISS